MVPALTVNNFRTMSTFSRESCMNADGDLSYKRIKVNLLEEPRRKGKKGEKNQKKSGALSSKRKQ